MDDKMITTAEAGEIMGVSTQWVSRECGAGHLPGARKFGAAWMVPLASARAWTRRPQGWRKGKARIDSSVEP